MLLPLCSLEEVRGELAEVEADLESMLRVAPTCRERWEELRATRIRWRDRLRAQVDAMEASDGR